jgi:hypothetical protein
MKLSYKVKYSLSNTQDLNGNRNACQHTDSSFLPVGCWCPQSQHYFTIVKIIAFSKE